VKGNKNVRKFAKCQSRVTWNYSYSFSIPIALWNTIIRVCLVDFYQKCISQFIAFSYWSRNITISRCVSWQRELKQYDNNANPTTTFRLSLRAEYSTQIMYDAIMIAGMHTPAILDALRKSRWCSPSNITARAVPPATYLPVRRWSSWQQKYHMRVFNEFFVMDGHYRDHSFCILKSNATDRYFHPL